MDMRLPRARFTVRLLMIVVAIVAIALGGEMMRRRWVAYRDMAASCARFEAHLLAVAEEEQSLAAFHKRQAKELKDRAKADKEDTGRRQTLERTAERETWFATETSAAAAYWRKRAAYYGRLENKHRRAAARPWQSVKSDPPERPEP
jgi:hypothetical protein